MKSYEVAAKYKHLRTYISDKLDKIKLKLYSSCPILVMKIIQGNIMKVINKLLLVPNLELV